MKHSLCMAFGLMSALSTALAGCADLEPATDQTAIEDLSLPSLRVQRGKQQVLLGVTDDGQALVWDAGVVYATVLLPGAPRSRVAEAAQAPLTMTVGRVALIWTAQPYFGALAPSPLVAWTAFRGAKLATSSSWPPALSAIAAGSAISADGREIIFSANVSSDGASGDLVRASSDLLTVTTLVTGASVSPFNGCAPHVGFARASLGDAVVSACAADDLGHATLARWAGAARRELSTQATPNIPWTSDGDGEHIVTRLLDRSSTAFDRDGTATIIESRSSLGWITADGVVVNRVRADPNNVIIERSTLDPLASETVTNVNSATGIMFANHLPQGIPQANLTPIPTSPDGSFYGGFNVLDPSTGLTDAYLVDLTTPGRVPIALRTTPDAIPTNEIATRNSSHMLYYTVDGAGNVVLNAGGRDGVSRQISTGATTIGVHYGIHDSVLVYSDNAVSSVSDPLSTTDIVVADVADPSRRPRAIAHQAHDLFFTTRDRRFIVYTSDVEAGGGLFVAYVR
jgi:hypothetical protein